MTKGWIVIVTAVRPCNSKIIKYPQGTALFPYFLKLRGCLHNTRAIFAPPQVHSRTLSWLYICLNDTTTKCHASARHSGVRFTPVIALEGEFRTGIMGPFDLHKKSQKFSGKKMDFPIGKKLFHLIINPGKALSP